ncbi:MAG: Uma2 family endonuclease [candidate division KSB1 bacterium]|nr:Uma2 family endonuclease [candidate division KSB1 bacterium]
MTTRKFTVDEYHTMIQTGILQEDDRVELLAGEIVEMSPIGKLHAAVVNKLADSFIARLRGRAGISVQNPVQLSPYSEPQPDLTLLKFRDDFYVNNLPQPKDIILVIEIGEASIDHDKTSKLPLYAQAGIPEVWLIDLRNEIVEQYWEPLGNQYKRFKKFAIGDELAPMAFSECRLAVKGILLK